MSSGAEEETRREHESEEALKAAKAIAEEARMAAAPGSSASSSSSLAGAAPNTGYGAKSYGGYGAGSVTERDMKSYGGGAGYGGYGTSGAGASSKTAGYGTANRKRPVPAAPPATAGRQTLATELGPLARPDTEPAPTPTRRWQLRDLQLPQGAIQRPRSE